MRSLAYLLLAIGLSVLLCVSSGAQERQPQRDVVRCEGKVKALGRGLLHVVGEEGQQWLVAVEAKPKDISFQGMASPSFLRPGMLVQFRAALDKRGQVKSTITELKVIAPRDGVKLGVHSDDGRNASELFASDDEPRKKRKKSQDGKMFTVAGTLRNLKERKIHVTAGGMSVKGELAENCSVTLDVSDFSLAREGDPITIQGWHYVGQPNQIYATQITITAEKPVTATEEAKKRRRAAKSLEKPASEGDSKLDAEKSDDASGTDGKK